MKIFEEPDDDVPAGVPAGVPTVDGSPAVGGVASSSSAPPGPRPPNDSDPVMPLGQVFLRIAQGPSLKNLVAFFACLCVFTALSNKVGTDDRCWHCSQRAKDDLEPQACAPARCDDPLALLDFFSSTFLGTFF